MQKRFIMMLCGVFAALFFYSCSMPSTILPKKVRVTGNPKFDLPFSTGAIDLNKMIEDQIGEGIDGLKLYDVVNYTADRKKIQAFLFHYKIIEEKLNPGDYLDQYDDAMDEVKNLEIPLDPIVQSIAVPDFGSGSGNETAANIALTELFDRALDVVQVSPSVPRASLITVGRGNGVIDTSLISIPSVTLDTFSSLTFHKGKLVMTVSISSVSPGVSITISGSQISGFYNSSDLPVSASGQPITLDTSNTTDTISFDLAGKTIKGRVPLVFSLGTITDNSSAALLTFNMDIGIDWEAGIAIKKAEGLKVAPIVVDLPKDSSGGDAFKIDMGNLPTEFLHAEIGEGSLTFDIPELGGNPPAGSTRFSNITVEYDITLKQDAHPFTNTIAGTNIVENYPGLNGDSPTGWRIKPKNNEAFSLAGKHINQKPIDVDDSSKLIITPSANGMDFEIKDDDLVAGTFPASFKQTIELKKMATVHWDRGNSITIPDITDKPNLKDAASNLRWIEFAGATQNSIADGIGINFVLDEIDIPGLEMALRCDAFDPPLVASRVLAKGDNIFKNDVPVKLAITPDNNGDVFLDFKIDLQVKKPDGALYGGGKVITITNIGPGDTLNFKTPDTNNGAPNNDIIKPFFNWTKASVSLGDEGNIDGQYPKQGDKPLNLYDMLGEYMEGFEFQGMQAKLYLSGPADLINKIEPKLSFEAKYGTASPLPLFSDGQKLNVLPSRVDLGSTNIYSDVTLPPGGTEIESSTINALMADLPSDLVFAYKMLTDEDIIVTPGMFDDIPTGESTMIAEVLIIMPLQLVAGPQGAKLKLSKMFAEDEDLFGREKDDEFSKFQAGSAYVNVEFNNEIFSKAKLFIDANGRVFPEGIVLGGKSINIKLNKSDLAALLNHRLIPDIRMEFEKGAAVSIYRDIGLTKISFGVSDLDLVFDLPDMGGK